MVETPAQVIVTSVMLNRANTTCKILTPVIARLPKLVCRTFFCNYCYLEMSATRQHLRNSGQSIGGT